MTTSTLITTTPRDILHIIFKYKWMILFLVFCVVTTVIQIINRQPVIYVADTKLLLKVGRENLYRHTTPEGTSAIWDRAMQERLNSELVILNGRDLHRSVIEKIGVFKLYPFLAFTKNIDNDPNQPQVPPMERAIKIFSRALNSGVLEKSNIIQITFAHGNPNVAAKVLNTLVDLFLIRHLELYQQPAEKDFFNQKLSEYRQKLQNAELELEKFKKNNNVPAIETQKQFLIKQISNFKDVIANTEVEITENEAQLSALEAKESTGETSEMNLDAITNIRNKVTTLKLEEQGLLSKYDENNILVVNIRQEITAAEELIKEEELTFFKKEKLSIQNKLDALNTKLKALNEQLTIFQKEIETIDGLEVKLKELTRNIELYEENYQLYMARTEEARISKEMDAQKMANISIVETAVPPTKPKSKNKLLSGLLAFFMSIFTGIGIAIAIETFRHNFNNSYDLKKHLDIEPLASIPEMKRKKFIFL